MPLIEAALAFAITMLALSLVVSSFVELVHRVFSMRQSGLQYMLGQMFDQVLAKYVVPGALITLNNANLPQARKDTARTTIAQARTAFVERMSANRAPMGVTPNATPTDSALKGPPVKWYSPRLWGGRDLPTMTPTEFMERLGSIDIGAQVKMANDNANTANAANAPDPAAVAAGTAAAYVADAVLKNSVRRKVKGGNKFQHVVLDRPC